MKGELVLSCNCTVFCPCVLSLGNHPPTEGYCQTWAGFRIDAGHFDAVDLSGLNLGLVMEIPGYMSRGNWTAGLYRTSEAEAFAEIAIRRGVPREIVFTETNATNLGENVRFSRDMLVSGPVSVIFVTKPQTQRRVLATAAQQWPEARAAVTAPLVAFEDQPTATYPMEKLIHEMTGDLERILTYPAKGFQIAQAVPLDVMEAYDFLIAQGFDGHSA